MTSFIPDYINNIHKGLTDRIDYLRTYNGTHDPSTINKQKACARQGLIHGQLLATVGLIVGVALTALGLATAASGALFASFFIFSISLPLCYLSYNAIQVTENMKDINEHPGFYRPYLGIMDHFDQTKLRQQLTKNTFCFEWIVDFAIQELVKKGIAQ